MVFMVPFLSDIRSISFRFVRMVERSNSKGKRTRAPEIVHRYNDTMGAVDLGDQLIAAYEPHFRSLKLWKKILIHLLVTATGTSKLHHFQNIYDSSRIRYFSPY